MPEGERRGRSHFQYGGGDSGLADRSHSDADGTDVRHDDVLPRRAPDVLPTRPRRSSGVPSG